MRITKQTPTKLIVKTNEKINLLIFGLVILALGLLVVYLVNVPPLTQDDLTLSRLLSQQQEGDALDEPEVRNSSVAKTAFKLAFYLSQLLFNRERPVILVALLGIMAGFIILLGPYRSAKTTFDKSQQQVMLKQPRWFFRSNIEVHPFQNISDVRVERDRYTNKKNRRYGVSVVISYNEGAPLSKNYIHYKTVFPLSESFRYDYERARKVVDRINAFIAENQTEVSYA